MNNITIIRISSFCLMASLWCSCSGNGGNQPQEQTELTIVTEHKLGGNTINVDRVAGKGKIKSSNVAPIYSLVDGILVEMNQIEGRSVKKGQTIAVIDNSEAMAVLAELEAQLHKKEYEVRTTYVGLGYKPEQADRIPADVRKSVETMTGYALLKLQIENQKRIIESHTIKAPFDGTILDIKVNNMGYAHKGEPLFYLMDTENKYVLFEVLETLLPLFKVGMSLEFTTLSYGDKVFEAELQTIAPNVESNGMVYMSASIKGKHPELLPGMTTFVNY
ncbi:MAG: efflux RND transporter periplasmic adaptor subunit [Bacteroidales bacterium]|nr:efflux RND transporter periplasmic adaptor subunit [Bacteroidales bacterium]